MAAYRVNHAYRSRRDGIDFGPYTPGTTVELEVADADWVNRDSPGCLTSVEGDNEHSDVDADGEAEPAKDRQHRGGRKRS